MSKQPESPQEKEAMEGYFSLTEELMRSSEKRHWEKELGVPQLKERISELESMKEDVALETLTKLGYKVITPTAWTTLRSEGYTKPEDAARYFGSDEAAQPQAVTLDRKTIIERVRERGFNAHTAADIAGTILGDATEVIAAQPQAVTENTLNMRAAVEYWNKEGYKWQDLEEFITGLVRAALQEKE